MKEDQPDYLSYLLRLWRVSGEKGPDIPQDAVWRASLEDPNTRERKAFAGLDELIIFLEEEMRNRPEQEL